jgi:hypothetical protein
MKSRDTLKKTLFVYFYDSRKNQQDEHKRRPAVLETKQNRAVAMLCQFSFNAYLQLHSTLPENIQEFSVTRKKIN